MIVLMNTHTHTHIQTLVCMHITFMYIFTHKCMYIHMYTHLPVDRRYT